MNRNIQILEYKNKVVLANNLTGAWLRITKEIYEYLVIAIKLNYSKELFIRSFVKPEDQLYIEILLNRMKELGIIDSQEIFFPKSITFEVTNRCNLKCSHCCLNANNNSEEMTTQKILQVLKKITKWGVDKITITGGEPLFRNDILKILAFLRQSFRGMIILSTNGVLINENNIEAIIGYVDRIDISIDGVDEESCSRVRGNGVFGKVIKSVYLLKKRGFDLISLSMVLTEENEKLVEKFMQLNQKLGTYPVIRRISWLGRALENKSRLMTGDIPYQYGAEIDCSEKGMCTYENCSNLVTKYHIRYDGSVYACQTIDDERYRIGHIDQISNFSKIKNNRLSMLVDDLLKIHHQCEKCEVMKFCWKCPVEIMEYTKNGSMKEHCKSVRNNLFHVIWEE